MLSPHDQQQSGILQQQKPESSVSQLVWKWVAQHGQCGMWWNFHQVMCWICFGRTSTTHALHRQQQRQATSFKTRMRPCTSCFWEDSLVAGQNTGQKHSSQTSANGMEHCWHRYKMLEQTAFIFVDAWSWIGVYPFIWKSWSRRTWQASGSRCYETSMSCFTCFSGGFFLEFQYGSWCFAFACNNGSCHVPHVETFGKFGFNVEGAR